jgi:hypothetical protein
MHAKQRRSDAPPWKQRQAFEKPLQAFKKPLEVSQNHFPIEN